jgi:hypothetical protein
MLPQIRCQATPVIEYSRDVISKDVGGRAKPHGRQLSAALLGVLSPSRVIPAEAGTQVYRGERHHANLAPRFREGRLWVPAFAGMT